MNDFLIIFGSILFSFTLGTVVMLFLGGRLTLNYLLVKWSKGKKILIWVDTPLGRISKIGKVEGEVNEGVISWNYLGENKLTELKKAYVGDFLRVKYISLNIETPERPYNLTVLGEVPARSIDQPTFNNLLKRALTRPSLDDDLAKKMKIVLIILGIVGLGVAVAVFKIINVEKLVMALGVV